MTNFDFLKEEPKFKAFADVAISAEKILFIDKEACILNCRRAAEFAIKWMYSVDSDLVMPYQDSLSSLMNTKEFFQIVDINLWKRLDFIRKVGNAAAHSGKKVTMDQAKLCLQNLFIFMDFVEYCYGDHYEEREYDPKLADNHHEKKIKPEENTLNVKLEELVRENKELREQLTQRRETQIETYVQKPLELTEYKTRKIYIDTLLVDAGWTEGRDWLDEVELQGMPNKSEVGYADYVLYGDDGKALAVIEAKRTCVDVSKGRQQAKLYADILEKKYGHIVTVESSLNYAARTYKKFREQEIQRVKDLWTSMPQDPRPLTDFIITSLDVTDEEIRKRKEQQGQKVTGDHPEVRIPVNREESFNFDDLLRRYRTLAFSSAQFDDLINAMRDNRTNADGDAMTGADRYQYGRLTLDVKREDDTAGTLRYDFSLFLHDNLQVVRIRGSIENKEMVLFSEDIWDMSSAFLLTGDLPKQKTSYDLNGNVLLDGFAMMTIYMLRLKLQKGIEIPQQ